MNNSSIPARLYAMADKRLLIMLAVIIGISPLGLLRLASPPSSSASTPSSSASTSRSMDRPGEEVSEEYFKKVHDKAEKSCRRGIEMLATHDLRWTTGFLEPYTFTRYNKYHREDGVFHMFGDKAEAQNGYGNWFRMNYICKFNPTTNQVIDVSLHKGRLPQ